MIDKQNHIYATVTVILTELSWGRADDASLGDADIDSNCRGKTNGGGVHVAQGNEALANAVVGVGIADTDIGHMASTDAYNNAKHQTAAPLV